MREIIQEWMAQAQDAETLAKIYAAIIAESEKQLAYISEYISKDGDKN